MNAGVGATRFIGKRLPRKEDPRLLTGKGTFVDDVTLPGTLHVAFARSPIARGRILSIDTSAARELPGVFAVLTNEDLAQIKVQFLSFFMSVTEVATTPLASGSVAYVGDPIVMVVADDRYIAEDAAALIEIEYDEEQAVVSIADARTGAPVHPDTDSNISAAMGIEEDEDLEALLNSAPHLITRTMTHQRVSQSPMEPRGILVAKQGDEEMLVYMACNSPHLTARYITQSLGLPDLSVRVIAKDVGGSFGLKNHPWREEMSVVVAAMLLGRPLKWIEDRIENLTAANQGREQEMTTRIGFDDDGKIVATHSHYNLNNGAYPQGADANVGVHMFMWAAHKVDALGFYSVGWYSNTVGLAAYRGPWALESLAREAMFDIAARQLGIDPIEIRRRNLITKADQPRVTPLGIPLDDITPAECLDKLLEVLDVKAFRAEQEAARKLGRYLGLGFATYIEPTGSAGSVSTMTGEMAQVHIEPTGKVTATLSTHSQGHGTQTTMAQVIADTLGVRYEDVSVFEGDSSRGGFSPGAAGSRQGVIGGGAATKAARLLADKVKRVAGHMLNANPDDISIEGGMVHIAGAPEMSRSLREIAEIAYAEPTRLPPGVETGLEAQIRYDPPPLTFTSAAHACIVEVDAETGFVKVNRWLSSEDCGNVINPAVVEGQIAGGLAQAIGMVLMEEAGYDERGNPVAVTYKDYLLPAISDIPDIEFIHASTPSKTEGGFRGVGEGGAIIGPPTLFNAIADALSPFGEIPIELPLTPSKILSVIEGRPIAEKTKPAAELEMPTAEDMTHAPIPTKEDPGMGAGLAGIDPTIMQADSSAATGIDGKWIITLFPPIGGPQPNTGQFTTDGEKMTGRMDSEQGSMEFEGTYIGSKLKWDVKVTKPVPVTLKFDLDVDGDKITGKVKMGLFGTAKVVGERVEE
jgi:carbon-monoxide dehydrogenase large subunit